MAALQDGDEDGNGEGGGSRFALLSLFSVGDGWYGHAFSLGAHNKKERTNATNYNSSVGGREREGTTQSKAAFKCGVVWCGVVVVEHYGLYIYFYIYFYLFMKVWGIGIGFLFIYLFIYFGACGRVGHYIHSYSYLYLYIFIIVKSLNTNSGTHTCTQDGLILK